MVASMTGMDEQMHRLKRESASHMDEQLDLTAQLDDAAGQLEEAVGLVEACCEAVSKSSGNSGLGTLHCASSRRIV